MPTRLVAVELTLRLAMGSANAQRLRSVARLSAARTYRCCGSSQPACAEREMRDSGPFQSAVTTGCEVRERFPQTIKASRYRMMAQMSDDKGVCGGQPGGVGVQCRQADTWDIHAPSVFDRQPLKETVQTEACRHGRGSRCSRISRSTKLVKQRRVRMTASERTEERLMQSELVISHAPSMYSKRRETDRLAGLCRGFDSARKRFVAPA
ncbi:uncharacterized protein TRIREDRAFT_107971 [Trichoderma reesei QM6a]|uniref:Predicted protein n=2 Tax=Hypocrea jecorina TaxID=51453 RepID=G0RK51_HYPJQ|nr:uncharacterized protein TRIREDRAFT_107971 [Trichoderma reesei QM6a]EGR48310.1 predicted protein [Trichoderma reesei QM6a]ETS07197.1 hypothetical protein M419DRAFT_126626 [Trichoderma reesei RUT C-30]